MTERHSGHPVLGTHVRRLAMLMAIAFSVLFCACSSGAGSSTGVLKGTASPCIRPATYNTSHAWTIKVILRRGSTVVTTKTVLDTQAAGNPVIHQIFTFNEPPGSYSVSGPSAAEQTVVIKAGTTSTVALSGVCK
jgi:hypothetical protein